jgi:tetratricopeptide (TPR) repeat protein
LLPEYSFVDKTYVEEFPRSAARSYHSTSAAKTNPENSSLSNRKQPCACRLRPMASPPRKTAGGNLRPVNSKHHSARPGRESSAKSKTPAPPGSSVSPLLLARGVLTWKQTPSYADQKALWQDTPAKNPACWMAHNNLGIALSDNGRMNEAVSQYREAIRLKPDYTDPATISLARGQ